MQDLTSWSFNDHENGEDLVNDLGHCAVKDCNPAARCPLLKKAHVQASLKFASEHLNDSEENWVKVLWSDETKIELFGINSTRRI